MYLHSSRAFLTPFPVKPNSHLYSQGPDGKNISLRFSLYVLVPLSVIIKYWTARDRNSSKEIEAKN